MDFYEGINDDTVIHGGGSYVEEHGYGHEIYNFKKIKITCMVMQSQTVKIILKD